MSELYIKSFPELTTEELYEILRTREAVFIVEQRCPYPEADGKDYEAMHLYYRDDDGRVVAYLRLYEKKDDGKAWISYNLPRTGKDITVHYWYEDGKHLEKTLKWNGHGFGF